MVEIQIKSNLVNRDSGTCKMSILSGWPCKVGFRENVMEGLSFPVTKQTVHANEVSVLGGCQYSRV